MATTRSSDPPLPRVTPADVNDLAERARSVGQQELGQLLFLVAHSMAMDDHAGTSWIAGCRMVVVELLGPMLDELQMDDPERN